MWNKRLVRQVAPAAWYHRLLVALDTARRLHMTDYEVRMLVTGIRQPFGNERLTGRNHPGCSDDRILAIADDQAVK